MGWERLNRGEMLVEALDTFLNTEKDTMDDVRENDRMSETCPTRGPNNILRTLGRLRRKLTRPLLHSVTMYKSQMMKLTMMSQPQLMGEEVPSMSKLLGERTWPRLMKVVLMYMSKLMMKMRWPRWLHQMKAKRQRR